jgi:hypothetical protein
VHNEVNKRTEVRIMVVFHLECTSQIILNSMIIVFPHTIQISARITFRGNIIFPENEVRESSVKVKNNDNGPNQFDRITTVFFRWQNLQQSGTINLS